MKKIRNNIFETNSSSTHTLSYCNSPSKKSIDLNTSLDSFLDENGEITITGGNYGWEGEPVFSCLEKINYLWTLYCDYYGENKNRSYDNKEDYDEPLKGFTQIIQRIYPNLKKINFDFLNSSSWAHGYIDHESADLIGLSEEAFKEFLTSYCYIDIGNDNY